MDKIKIFSDSNIDRLEQMINDFLSDNIYFRNLIYKITLTNDNNLIHSVLLIYRER